MAKKPKTPLKDANPTDVSKSNEGSNSSTVFKALFGEIQEQNSASDSLFSDNNPFRRKLLETKLANRELELANTEKSAADYEGKQPDSDLPQTKRKKKRNKDEVQVESSDLGTELVEEKSKKLKRADSRGNKIGNSNFGIESNEAVEKAVGHVAESSQISDVGVENEKKTKKKRKRDEVESEYEARRYGVADETKENKTGNNSVLGEKRKTIDNPEDMMVSKEGFDDESKLLRTVFVGNLPLKFKKKEITKVFDKFGEVESVRIRSVPLINGKLPRKGAAMKNHINEKGDSVHAYIVFKTEEAAQASLANNMAVVGGNHIRVDRACPPRKKLKDEASSLLYDTKRTVFIGNLPFDVKDEEVYKLFCGMKTLETSVEAVRVIRDPGFNVGKGIAYVLFKTAEAANLVLRKRNVWLRNRELRLSHAKKTETPSKRKDPSEAETYNNSTYSADKRSTFTHDSGNNYKAKADLSYQGMRASKSGAQKKVHTRINLTPKSRSEPDKEQQNSRVKKRPAVAARKEKALKAASASQFGGTNKRKMGNRTPGSASGQKKKARTFR
ncbi:hypothetical protein ACP275_05G073900 [Erythranthe tilingii]